ncbi:PGF-CTERM sorting domain-containing protein [Candidatus Poseidoniaceae archaeon]|nr:PGF-CTERM sorting domain-containing protein [Candidatus Poseidoniaceae archaeon]
MKVQTLLLTLMLLLSGCLGMADEDAEKIDENDMFPDDDAAYFDTDGDGLPDQLDGESTSTPPLVADMDDDNDGFLDSMETTCGTDPLNATSFPDDLDGDFECDEYDFDIDGDTVFNDADAFPRDASAATDTDGDGMPNTLTGESTLTEDLDDDNDGWSDVDETACGSNSLVATLMPVDANGDGICDAVSTDDDADTYSDDEETQCGSDPLDATSIPADLDNDTICDALDDDMDGDGTANADDMYPRDPSKHEDVPGCTDTAAFNFNAEANLDDGTCVVAEDVFGMMMNFMANETWHISSTSAEDIDGDGAVDVYMSLLFISAPSQDTVLINQAVADGQGEEVYNVTYQYTNGTIQLSQSYVEEGGDFDEDTVIDDQVLIHHQYMETSMAGSLEWLHCEELSDNAWVCSDSEYFTEGNPDSATETLHVYTCADGTTIMSNEINDGTEDCADGSDEPQYTETYSYTCLSGETIGLMHVNDGEDDCADGSDEAKIFQCADGSYVTFLYANDGGADCNDESDEPMYDTTEISTFDCMDGSEIYLSQVNDGVEDCMDADDEPTYEETEQTYFDCDDGMSYIYLSQVNDGTEDCADGEDEATFDENGDETSTFECEYTGDIIPFSYVNDGMNDCTYGEDEPYIGEEETSSFDCADGSDTIDLSEVNDDNQDCEDESDEPAYDMTETSMFDCEDGSQIYFSLANDGAEDCANGEDEPSEEYVEYSTFDCADGETIALSLVNDGAEDCRDGDDEPSYDPITQQELSTYDCWYSGGTIALSLVNDGNYDCDYGEDEPMGDDEETSLFTCDDGEEIYMSWLNDDYNDCQGGEDEAQYDMGEEISVFTCDDGTEIAFSMVNNGDNDCDGDEDESYTYECADGSDTIPLRYVNVGYYFCQDNSDVSDAEESSEFTCFDGETISLSYYFDDEADCSDRSDEIDWEADWTDCVYDAAGFWACTDTMPQGIWSGEMQDDGSMIVMFMEEESSTTININPDMSIASVQIEDDEPALYTAGTGDHDLMMDMTLEEAAPPFAVGFDGEAIQSATFECNDGTIIEFALLNDGAYDCADEEDEPDYEEEEMSYWMCADGAEEIPLSYVSDGDADCEDGSDEVLTSNFDCDDGTTITLDMVSDDNIDCAEGEDEPEYDEGQDTNVFYCADGSDSVPMEWVNDDDDDCEDGSDEGAGQGHGYGDYMVEAVGMAAGDLIEWNGGSLTDATSADGMDLVLSMCDSFNTIEGGEGELSVAEDCGDDVERWSFVDIAAGNVVGIEFFDADESGTLTNGDMFMITEDLETMEDWNAVRLAKGMAYADENPEVVLPGFTAALGIISMLGAALLVRKNE